MKIKIDGRSFIYPDSDIEWFDSLGNIKYRSVSKIIKSRPTKGDKMEPEDYNNFKKVESNGKVTWVIKNNHRKVEKVNITNKIEVKKGVVKIKSGGRWFEYPEDQIESWNSDGNIKWSDKVHWKFTRNRPKKGDEFVYDKERFLEIGEKLLYKKYKGNKKEIINNVSIFLKGKKIILVGPAPTVINKLEFINSFDIVVRLNDSYNTKGIEIDYGIRTDILYLNGDRGRKIYTNELSEYYYDIIKHPFNTKFILSKNYININKENIDKANRQIFDEVYSSIMGYEKCKINNGFNIASIAILDLLLYQIDELLVIGLSFYDEEVDYYNNNHVKNIKNLDEKILRCDPSINKHPQKEQKNFLYNLSINDKRLKFDDKTFYYLTKNI